MKCPKCGAYEPGRMIGVHFCQVGKAMGGDPALPDLCCTECDYIVPTREEYERDIKSKEETSDEQ